MSAVEGVLLCVWLDTDNAAVVVDVAVVDVAVAVGEGSMEVTVVVLVSAEVVFSKVVEAAETMCVIGRLLLVETATVFVVNSNMSVCID